MTLETLSNLCFALSFVGGVLYLLSAPRKIRRGPLATLRGRHLPNCLEEL